MRQLWTVVAAAAVVILVTGQWALGQLTFGESVRTIVLDPGHGGYDSGAKGAEGVLEKQVTLALARQVAHSCGNPYRMVLTRSDDYSLEIPDRTAVANGHDADLFISIHTGGSYRHQTQGLSVYYHQMPASPPEPGITGGPEPAASSPDPAAPIPWDRLQERHLASSKQLATSVHRHLVRHLGPAEDRLEALPLAVLQGADMPAVLVEVGYVTHPATAAAFQDNAYVTGIAEAICGGIDEFFAITESAKPESP